MKAGTANGITLIELLVVIFIISVLAGALVPMLSRVRERTQSTYCVANMHQVLLGLRMYLADYQEIPMDRGGMVVVDAEVINPGIDWISAVKPYVAGRDVFLCPADHTKGRFQQPGIPSAIPCSWDYLYTPAACAFYGCEGKIVAAESPVLNCFWWHPDVTIIGRKDGSVEVAPLHKYREIHAILE